LGNSEEVQMPSTRAGRASLPVVIVPGGIRRAAHRGFALFSLLVVILIAAFLIAVLIPSICHSGDAASRLKCTDNLRQIGLGLEVYATDNEGQYPRTRYEVARVVIPDVSSAGANSINPFAANSTVPINCVPSALFLLLRTHAMPSAIFLCPSTAARPDSYGGYNVAAIQRGNFTAVAANLSYSYANPYPDSSALAKGFRLSVDLNSGFALLADLNPGASAGSDVLSVNVASSPAQMHLANSRNHSREGQNILFADGHIEFDGSPLVGINHDNIYCRGNGGPTATNADIVNSPRDANDSVLLPADRD
jgi:prepilin-type processing-associated H-X9-DG protein